METPLPLEQYRLLVEHAPTLVWRAGLDGLCNYFNTTWLRFTGRTLEQEVGNGWVSGVHPDDIERTRDEIRRVLTDDHHSIDFETRLQRDDGSVRLVSWRAVGSAAREPVGEQRVDPAVGGVGLAAVVDQVHPEVQQRPQRAVGEPVVVVGVVAP